MKVTVSVESPALKTPRKGRGFSKDELVAVKLSIKEAREAGLIVDLRRKSKYKVNVEALKLIKEDYAKYLVEAEKAKIKVRKENVKARKEAAKRKKSEAELEAEREKEIEEEKKKIQEEIAKREADELAAETEPELSEDELAELDTLEDEAPTGEESTEETLEKLEEDLAESLGEPEDKTKTVTAADGTTRVVKRVRKKPTTTTKGVSDAAEKKE